MEAMRATEVSRGYGAQTVLKGLSLTVEAGSFEALMGPSGSGKSTFLHIAAGLLKADSGSVMIGGREVTAMSDAEAAKFRRRHLGFVFQSFNLLNEKSVRMNILMPLVLELGSTAKALKAGAAKLAELAAGLGLADLLDRMPEELSGGERQRVALARALIAEPEIVLADEPTGNLDAESARSICELFKSINAKSAILVVTHDPVVAAAARRVHFLKDGRIAASCATEGDAARISQKYLETCR